jgi:hypothetical protein
MDARNNKGAKNMNNATITVIDFTVSFANIADLDKMTPEARALIMGVERIESSGFQEVIGRNGRKAVWAAGASFNEETGKWELSSLGNGKMVELWK